MKYSFEAQLIAYIEVTDKEFNDIWKCMETHYDMTVKEAVSQGGFMWGLRNMRTPYEGQKEEDINRYMQLNSRQIGIVLKGMENHHCLLDFSNQLISNLCKVLKKMGEKFEEINKPLEEKSEI